MEIAKVAIFLDSQLLVNQIKGTFAAKHTSIKDYLQKVKTTLRGFKEYTVEHVRRNQNKKSDALSKLASMTFEHLTKEVLVKVLTKRSIEEKEVLKVDMQERKSWMDPIHEYILSGLFPEDTKESRKIIIQAPQYKLIRGNLYKRSFFTTWLHLMRNHTHKLSESRNKVTIGHRCTRKLQKQFKTAKKCKEQSAIRKAGTSGAIVAGSTWPFSHWGIHILGSLPMALGGLQFLAIAVEHSTKWVEAKPLTTINRRQVEKFVWEYVGKSAENNQGKGKKGSGFDRKGILLKQVAKIPQRKEHPMYIMGDFVLPKRNANEWQGPYIINEFHKEEVYTIVDTIDHSLVQTTKGTSLQMKRASQDQHGKILDLKMEQRTE
ncbi:reverse transcriptase domain-containing protein [Tanacetum coccineum]